MIHQNAWDTVYFIPKSEFNAYMYLKQIKVILVLSTVKIYSFFLTSDEYDLYLFHCKPAT